MASASKRLVPLVSMVRSIHTTSARLKMGTYEKIMFNLENYRKYGLLKDDMLLDRDPIIKEALQRIPEKMLMERIFRATVATQLYLQHDILPKEKWTTVDDDHDYLQPYVKEIEAELLERDMWEKSH